MSEQENISRLKQQRLDKLSKLENLFDIDPYILNLETSEKNSSKTKWAEIKTKRQSAISAIKDIESKNLAEGERDESAVYWIAGRIHSNRNKGMFLDIHDQTDKIQVVVDKDELENPESYIAEDLKRKQKVHFLGQLDKGDIVAVKGIAFCTPSGQTSLRAKELIILSKALLPPPEIIEDKNRRLGLTDVEVRYRQRYLDLMVNADVRETFTKRSKVLSNIRHYLDNRDFLEFETPILQTEAGGANAKPFITHHNALDMQLYLRIATELHLKRLLVGGFERVYEMGRIFRNEGISTRHNPEFTSVEIYQAFADYQDVLDLTRDIIIDANRKVNNSDKIPYGDDIIDLSPENWACKSMTDIIHEVTGKEVSTKTVDELKAIAKELKVHIDEKKTVTKGEIITEIFEETCEDSLVQPTFVLKHAWEKSPLAGSCPEDDLLENSEYKNSDSTYSANKPKAEYAHRFELYITGKEIANGFAEQNDPRRQLNAFTSQVEKKTQGDDEAHPLDEDFIKALEYAMPPAGGVGIGIDRLVMLLTNSQSIREVILFPTMKS